MPKDDIAVLTQSEFSLPNIVGYGFSLTGEDRIFYRMSENNQILLKDLQFVSQNIQRIFKRLETELKGVSKFERKDLLSLLFLLKSSINFFSLTGKNFIVSKHGLLIEGDFKAKIRTQDQGLISIVTELQSRQDIQQSIFSKRKDLFNTIEELLVFNKTTITYNKLMRYLSTKTTFTRISEDSNITDKLGTSRGLELFNKIIVWLEGRLQIQRELLPFFVHPIVFNNFQGLGIPDLPKL